VWRQPLVATVGRRYQTVGSPSLPPGGADAVWAGRPGTGQAVPGLVAVVPGVRATLIVIEGGALPESPGRQCAQVRAQHASPGADGPLGGRWSCRLPVLTELVSADFHSAKLPATKIGVSRYRSRPLVVTLGSLPISA